MRKYVKTGYEVSKDLEDIIYHLTYGKDIPDDFYGDCYPNEVMSLMSHMEYCTNQREYDDYLEEAKEIFERYLESYLEDEQQEGNLAFLPNDEENNQEELNKQNNPWYTVRGFIKDVIKTFSDIGSVKLMSIDRNQIILIPNGYGDGITRIGILAEHDKFDSMLMRYHCTIKGEWLIASYDCGNKAVANLNGSYNVYSYDGIVIFKEVTFI